MAKKAIVVRPYKMKRFGILNPHGQIWSCNTFDEQGQAVNYLRGFWRDTTDIKKFKIVPVTVTVELSKAL